MKQKALTPSQKLICEELKALFEKATQNGIQFVADSADGIISAYNGEGIDYIISSDMKEEGDVPFDWDETFNIFTADGVNTNCYRTYASFHQE